MAKQDKNFRESGLSDDMASAEYTTMRADLAPATPPPSEAGQAEQSRRFNLWLDRALPLLQQYLTSHTTMAVTLPDNEPKP